MDQNEYDEEENPRQNHSLAHVALLNSLLFG